MSVCLLIRRFIVTLQLLSLLLYARFSTGNEVAGFGSDLLDAVAVKPLEDEVDSEDKDDEDLLTGIDDENVREAFRVCHAGLHAA